MKTLPRSCLAVLLLASVVPSARAEWTYVEARWTGTIEVVREGTREATGGDGVSTTAHQRVVHVLDGGETAASTVEHQETLVRHGVEIPAFGMGAGRVDAGAIFIDDGQGGTDHPLGWYVSAAAVPMAMAVAVPTELQGLPLTRGGINLLSPAKYRDIHDQAGKIKVVVDTPATVQRLEGTRETSTVVPSVFFGNVKGTETVTWDLRRVGTK